MKNNTSQKPPINTSLVIGYILHAASLAMIIFLVYKVNLLEYRVETINKKGTELNMQMLQFNARTNNLKSCWQNNDYACPENKYFDGSKFIQD
ncbi:hypothetical protein EOL73_03215 [Candidatus Saccharibacteria bacterium]|nr:hypothetical protein [Candidatus Saccharibacteria bacterium]NCU40739.1 hypothetical protein [Candidatus Saccharibacteria bacterium]